MIKNWIAWLVCTICINAIASVTKPLDMYQLLVITNSLWAMGTVMCLYNRRESGKVWQEVPDDSMVDLGNDS